MIAVVLNDVTKLVLAATGMLSAVTYFVVSVRKKSPTEGYVPVAQLVACESKAAKCALQLNILRQRFREHLKADRERLTQEASP